MMTEEVKQAADYTAATIGAMSFFEWVHPVAGLFTIVWLFLRIWETKTVSGLIQKLRNRP